MSLPCVLRLPLFWPSLVFLTTFLFFPPGASVESQFLRDGVLPPGRVSSVGVFVHSFPWFTSCPLLLMYFSSASFVSVLLSEALSFILGFSQLLLFPLFFIVFSSHPVVVHLSAFKLIISVFFLLLGRETGKFSRLPPQVFSFSSSSPLRPLRLASSSIPAGPLCPGDTIACPLPYRLRNEPVVMVWSTHSHIGRCSCGDSWVHLFVSFDDRCVLGIPSLARSHIGCAMSLW